MIEDGGILYSQIDSQLPSFVQTDHTKFSKFIQKYYEFLELNLITFTDLDLNADSIIQEKADTTYTITVATGNNAFSNSANKFYVDGAVSPTITLIPGAHAIFDQGDENNVGHYFHISRTPDGIHTAGGKQFTTDDREDVLFTFVGQPGDYDNITLEAETGILLYEDYLDSATTLDNLTLEDASGILLYEDDVELGFETTPDREIGLEASATIKFYVSPDLAGETLYYYCNNHSGMGGNITVSTTTSYISQENGNTHSANTSTEDYLTLENPNRQGEQFLSGETILGANSGATGIVRGKYSTTQAFVEETNHGSFEVGETIKGKTSRVTATVNSYSRQPINASRNVKAFQDIDKAPVGFVELFRKEFLTGFSKNDDINTPNLLKHIKDFYRSKGNENSFRFIFSLLFGIDDVEFYYPGQDIMRLSDGRWTLDKSVKLLTDSASYVDSFLGRTIVGQTSNVSALVERIERYHVGAQDITELFLSGFDANNAAYQATTGTSYTTFYLGEVITANSADSDGNYATATTSGVLQGVDIVYGGSGYNKGDELRITGGGGAEAKAKVSSIAAAALTGIDVIDSGDGYSVGDVVTFFNDGTGGTGGSARVQSIVKTVNVFTQTEVISTQGSTTLDAAAFTAPWGSYNRNTHSSSNSTTTFTVPFDGLSGGDTPKQGDFIAKFGSGESISLYTPGTSKFGTVISTNSTSITYGLGSIDYTTSYNSDPTLNNFVNNDTVVIFDLTKDKDGSAVTSNAYNSTFRATGATIAINGTPTANTDSTYHGAATMQESSIGGIRSLQIMSSGQGYETIPPVSIANTEITFYDNSPEKVGANSIFVNLANTVANIFTSNTLIKNQGNTAFGILLDYLDLASTTLAETGNTTLRIQMTSANTFSPNDVLTSYSRADSSPSGIGVFGTANISTSGTTATFTQADHGFGAGDRIVITGSSSATDNTVYNNNHTIAGITNSSVYTVTLASDPSDDSETSLTVRKIVTANVVADLLLTEDSTTTQISFENGVGTANDDYSSSTSNGSIIVESGIDEANSIFANTGIPGNNAIIQVSKLAVGAIESVLVYDFGAGYSSAPTINASAVGDGSATLTGNVGVYAEYSGYFDGEYGLLSGTNKMQDNLYYQDFSYVVKTNKDVNTYREKILELVHPAGMALFGEILMSANLSVKLFDDGTSNISSTQANTEMVANSVNVPRYHHHEVEFYTKDTTSTNNQISMERSYELKSFSTEITIIEKFDVNMDTTGASSDFDLQLEHGHDLISLENSGFFLAAENTGELLLERDIGGGVGDRLIEETADFLLTEAEIVHVLLEEDSNDTDEDILLLDDGETDKGNASIIGALSDENQSDSSPIIYEFFEAELGNILTEDGDGIGVNLISTDVLEIEEYNGDFIVLDGIREFGYTLLEDGGQLLLDEVTLTGGPIGFESGRGTVLLNSTDGAPGSNAGDQIVTEDYTFEAEPGSVLTEDTGLETTGGGTYLVQEDEAGKFSQGFKIQQEGVFTAVITEGRLVQENEFFILLENQIASADFSLSLEPTTPNAFSGPQTAVYMELENSIGGDSTVRPDKISHFVLEEDEDLVQTLTLEDGTGDIIFENGKGHVRLEIQGVAQTVKIRNEDEASNFKLEDFESVLVQEEQYQIQLESYTLPSLTDVGFLVKEDNDALHLEEAGAYDTDSDEFYATHGLFTFVKASARLNSQDSDMRDVKFNNDGTKMFALGRGNDGVYEYSLSTAFDVSTLTFVQKLDISGEETSANSLEFNLDGTKLFVLGQSDDNVDEYALSTGFDISTASFTDSFDVSTQETAPYGLAFNNDGTKMYVCGWNGDDINEYTLTTAFDVSTASYSQNFSINAQRANASAVQFNADGTKMYVLQGNQNSDIFEYALVTPFDISTASYTNRTHDLTNEESRARGFCFSNNHSQLFVTGWTEDEINEYTVNYTLPDESGADSGIDDTPFYFRLEDDVDARAYLLEEPTTIYHRIESENPADDFVIVTDDAEDTIVLEIEEFITDTNFKGESYDTGTGFMLPMLIFPTAESGSALLDLSFTSRIVLEIDDIQNVRLENQDGSLLLEDGGVVFYEQQPTTSVGYQYDMLLLEESDGTNPVFIATESSMTEEIDGIGEIELFSDGNYSLQLEGAHGIHDNGLLVYENGGFTLEAGTNAEGVIIFDGPTADDGDRSLLEDGVEDTIGVNQPQIAASVRSTVSTLNTGDTLNEGSFLGSDFGERTYGSVALSLLPSEFEFLTEDGKTFVTEESTTRKDNLISEAYDRGIVATGTATQFEFDFNNLIVLEPDWTLDVIELEDGLGKIIDEHGYTVVLEIQAAKPEVGVIILETDTPEENSIILESDDPDVIIPLQQEQGEGKIFTEEDIHLLIPSPERLCGVGLHDLILEEEGILQEESDQIKLEDFTLDNITQEDPVMGDFVPYLGFGDEGDNSITIDDNMLLESTTHKTENVCVQTEDGDLIGQEDDETSHIVLEDFYFKYYNVGTITQTGTTITVSGGQFPSAVVNSGRFFYESGTSSDLSDRNGVESTDIISISDSGLELTVEASKSISSAQHYKVEYGLDDTPVTAPAEYLVMEAYTLDTTTEQVRIDIIFNGEGDVNHGYTRGEDSDGLGTYTVSISAFADIIGNDVTYEDGERILAEDSIGGYIAFEDSTQNVSLGIAHGKILNEDDTGCFISTEDHEGNETTQDDNVLMKEMSDALLLEDSETETLNYVLSEEEGQMMLEDVFQVSEHKIIMDSHDSILIEDQPDGDNWNYKLLNMDMGRFDIETIANNASMTIQFTDSSTSSTDFFKRSDSAILVSRTEQIV